MRRSQNRSQFKKRKKSRGLLPYVIFLVGLLIAAYPYISQYYYHIEANDTIKDYISTVSQMNQEEIDRKLSLAKAYNSTLKPSRLSDPFTDLEKEGYAEYARMLAVKEKLGFVSIPSIGQDIPIYAGTSEEILEKGAGYLEGTSLPVGGNSTHTVITAHTGLHKAKLFTDLDKMKKGEIFYLHVLDQVLAYQVDQILVVEPTEFEHVLVEESKDFATLLTCTPYGVNSHRLLVRGKRVSYEPEVAEKQAKSTQNDKLWLVAGGIILFITLVVLVRIVRKRGLKG